MISLWGITSGAKGALKDASVMLGVLMWQPVDVVWMNLACFLLSLVPASDAHGAWLVGQAS